MTRITAYTLHSEAEHRHKTAGAGEVLEKLRTLQQAEARNLLTGKTVTIYHKGKILGKLHHCEVGDSTATACFTLIERGEIGEIVRNIAITPNMKLFMEHAHV